jgi:hypothetical protein
LESWSLQLCNDTKMSPQLKSLIFIVTSIVYGSGDEGIEYHDSYMHKKIRTINYVKIESETYFEYLNVSATHMKR